MSSQQRAGSALQCQYDRVTSHDSHHTPHSVDSFSGNSWPTIELCEIIDYTTLQHTQMQMITKEWLESILTSYYIFIEHFQGDPDLEVKEKMFSY